MELGQSQEPEEEIETSEAPPEPEPQEEPPEEMMETLYGDTPVEGDDLDKIISRIRNITNDLLNRHERFQERILTWRDSYDIHEDWGKSHLAGLQEIERERNRSRDVIDHDRSTVEAIRQELDTLQRTNRDQRRQRAKEKR